MIEVRSTGYLKTNLAEVFGCHDAALELVCGADFPCKLMLRANPKPCKHTRLTQLSPVGCLYCCQDKKVVGASSADSDEKMKACYERPAAYTIFKGMELPKDVFED